MSWQQTALGITLALAARIHVHKVLHWLLGKGRWKTADRVCWMLECVRILVRPAWLTPAQGAVVRALWLVQWRKRYTKAEAQVLLLWSITAAEWWLNSSAELGLLANIACFIF